MTKHMTLPEMCPELNKAQWQYLYVVLDDALELSFVQRDKLVGLLGVTIQL